MPPVITELPSTTTSLEWFQENAVFEVVIEATLRVMPAAASGPSLVRSSLR